LPERTTPQSFEGEKREKDIASPYLPFLVAFISRPLGFGRETDKTEVAITIEVIYRRINTEWGRATSFGESHSRYVQVTFTAAS